MVNFAIQVKDKLDFTVTTLDLGGGYRKPRPHPFGPNGVTSIPTISDHARTVASVLTQGNVVSAIGRPKLLLESGGFIVTDAATLLPTVGMTKDVSFGPGAGKLLRVDTSPYQYVRRLIFNFYHETIVANKVLQPKTQEVDIIGNTSADDYLASSLKIQRVEKGDILATLDQGSYCEMISTQYCGIPRPATVLVNPETTGVIRRRETPEEILSQYEIPTWLTSDQGATWLR